MAEPLLAASHVSKTFRASRGLFRPAANVYAVDDVSLHVDAGETLSIVGESGCGKSTLLRLLSRLIDPDKGALRFAGRDLMALSRSDLRRQRDAMQMVFQDPFASLDPRMRVGAILDEPLRLHGRGNAQQRRARVNELLDLVGLAASHVGRFPHEFSGGQRQRIGIARALALNPKLILADEPVSALDVSVQAQIINLLQDLQDRFGLSYVIVAHDLTVVRHMSDRVAVMYLGRVVEMATSSQIFTTPRHPYTHGLLAAIPVPRPGLKRSAVLLQGDAPSPTAPPSGCHFHTRCAHAQARCSVDVPALRATPDGHAVACHFWREIEPAQGLATREIFAQARPYQARLDAAARRRSAATFNAS